jgi:hypothetical protein
MINETAIKQSALGNSIAGWYAHRLYIQPNFPSKRNPNKSSNHTHLANCVANINTSHQPTTTHRNRNANSQRLAFATHQSGLSNYVC